MYQLNEKIRDLKPYDPVEARYRVHLDANESFLEVPQEIRREFSEAVQEAAFNRYPDPSAKALCEAFAGYYGVPPENVVAGNGSDELISVIFSGFLQKGEAFATIEPDFSMYAFNGQINEGRAVRIEKREDYSIDIDKVIETCNNENVRLLIFSNPCNPTSVPLEKAAVRRLLNGVRALVVLDEAYMDFCGESLLAEFDGFENLMILRTCSKAFGMAALRLGFAVARKELADALRAVKSPYNVNVLSQRLGTILLSHKRELREATGRILESETELRKGVEALERSCPGRFQLLKGSTNFVALRMDRPETALEFLAQKGIAVRLTGGLLRITCGRPEENAALLEALEEYFSAV